MVIVYLENAWKSKQMITEGEAAIPLETTRRAFGNQEKSKQRSAIVWTKYFIQCFWYSILMALFFQNISRNTAVVDLDSFWKN